MKIISAVLCVLCLLSSPVRTQSQIPRRHGTTPLGNLLTADGMLKSNSGFQGSLDPRGWRMTSGKNGAPRFVPASAAAVPADAGWDSTFVLRGFNAAVRSLAVSGSDMYAGGVFTTAGGDTVNHIARWDGSRWSALGSGMNNYVEALAVSGSDVYAGGYFTTAGGASSNYIAKWNGTSWSALGTGFAGFNVSVNALAVSGTDLYAGGRFITAGGDTVHHIAKWDGSNWSALGTGMNGPVNALAIIGTDLYAGGEFTIAGGDSVNYVAKWDGSTWSALGTGMSDIVYALATSGTDLYAGGWFITAGGVNAPRIARWNGSSWFNIGIAMNSATQAIAVSAGDVFAGGADGIRRWNGSNWSGLGSGLNGPANAIAVSGSDIYAGGLFDVAGNTAAKSIARWNGSDWSALGVGFGLDGAVSALTTDGTSVYALGGFQEAGDSLVHRIARWDGTKWSPIASGMNDASNPVHSLAVAGSALYVGNDVNNLAPFGHGITGWDGSVWTTLGSGVGPAFTSVTAIAVSGTDVYVGGNFSFANATGFTPVAVNNIARWNGTTWSALGSGTNGAVLTIAVSGTDIFAGGGFSTAGGAGASNIAKWNGSSWSALGSGTDGPVAVLTVIGNDVYAGGGFDTAGGVGAKNVAKWNGTNWSALGSGVNGVVNALAASAAGIYAGGAFTTAGGTGANFIARWNGYRWSALGSGMNSAVNALAAMGSDLYVGGTFSTAGNKHSSRVALWHQMSHAISASSGLHGAINPSGITNVVNGDDQAYTFAPNFQYHVDSLLIDGLYEGSPPGYVFGNVTGDHTIRVTFAKDSLTTVSVDITHRWNLVSVPLLVSNYSKDSLFSSSVSAAFAYQGNYVVSPTLANGSGYWLVFNNAQSLNMIGVALTADSIDVVEGWNLIGSISAPLAVTDIGSIPGGIQTSRYFGYAGIYIPRDTIEPGKGYWVKVNQAGKLILSSIPGNAPSGSRARIVTMSEVPPAPPAAPASNTEAELPSAFGLEQNYPNPFNPTTIIRYQLPVTSHVELKVFGMLGQEVGTLVDGVQAAGFKSAVWDASHLPSGVYYYRMTAGSFSSTKKTILIK